MAPPLFMVDETVQFVHACCKDIECITAVGLAKKSCSGLRLQVSWANYVQMSGSLLDETKQSAHLGGKDINNWTYFGSVVQNNGGSHLEVWADWVSPLCYEPTEHECICQLLLLGHVTGYGEVDSSLGYIVKEAVLCGRGQGKAHKAHGLRECNWILPVATWNGKWAI